MLIRTSPSGLQYPPIYSRPEGTEKQLDDALDAFFAATDSKRADWTVERAAISLVPRLEGPIPWSRGSLPVRGILIPQDGPTDFVTRAAIRLFIGHPEVFLGQSEPEAFEITDIDEKEEQCTTVRMALGEETHEACSVSLQQKYCGLEVGSDEFRYGGSVKMDMHRSSGRLWHVQANLVPHFPVYIQTPLAAADVRGKIMGKELSLGCPGGSVKVTEAATIDEIALGVFVRKSTQDTSRLEYRTAFKARVAPDRPDLLTWTVWVDAFDGSILKVIQHFICN